MTVSGTPEPSVPPATSPTRLSGRAVLVIAIGIVVACGALGIAVGAHGQSSSSSTTPPSTNPLAGGSSPSNGSTPNSGASPGDSKHASLGGGVVVVPVPDGWDRQDFGGDAGSPPTAVLLNSPGPDVASISVLIERKSGSTTDILPPTVAANLPTTTWSQVQTTPLVDVEVPATITSQASVSFSGIVTSDSTTAFGTGAISVYVRADGWVLETTLTAEHLDAAQAQQSLKNVLPTWGAVMGEVLQSFTTSGG